MYQCKDCKYLDMNQKFSVGYVCTNTKRKRPMGTRNLGHIKQPTTPACKTGFELKGVTEVTMYKTQIGDTCYAKASSNMIPITMNSFDEKEYDCWELIKSYAGYLGIELETEDDEEPDFWMAKQVQETILKLFTDAGFMLVRKDK